MTITDIDIEKAEAVLLPPYNHFDDERRNFIGDFSSCDLLAVPGSGKTTALQAKLCCISRHLPLDHNRGILVLSHTNNAVEEIKKHLGTECYNLFDAPHFIGTVQDFIDTFLAIPYYEMVYGQKVHVVDGKAYEEEVERYLRTHRMSEVTALCHKGFEFSCIRVRHDDAGNLILSEGLDNTLSFPFVKKWREEGTEEQKHNKVCKYISEMKECILQEGVLHYDDCYILAERYLKTYPYIRECLRQRFKYIFIDETQDLKKYQLDLIDAIFNNDNCCLQRIGDKNQTIFNRPDKKLPEQWVVRNEKRLLNSFRLTPTIANIVNPFTVDKSVAPDGTPKFVVAGKRNLGTQDTPPYLVLADNKTLDKVVACFNELIDFYSLRTCPEGKKYGFHVIGWSIKHDKDSKKKFRLEDIIKDIQPSSRIGNSSYDTVSEFICLGCREWSMTECKSVVVKILLCLLRKLNITHVDGRYYTKTKLEKTLSEMGNSVENAYKLFAFKASSYLFIKKFNDCYNLIGRYLYNNFSNIFKINADNMVLKQFFGDCFVDQLPKKSPDLNVSDIMVGSIHTSKGQTHCATMYVETTYKGYESEHLFKVSHKATLHRKEQYYPNPLFQEDANYPQTLSSSTMRMMYVGFSRPTHLLCYTVFKENWNKERIERMKQLGWNIIDLTVLQDFVWVAHDFQKKVLSL